MVCPAPLACRRRRVDSEIAAGSVSAAVDAGTEAEDSTTGTATPAQPRRLASITGEAVRVRVWHVLTTANTLPNPSCRAYVGIRIAPRTRPTELIAPRAGPPLLHRPKSNTRS